MSSVVDNTGDADGLLIERPVIDDSGLYSIQYTVAERERERKVVR